jgi:hypothetical protein
LSQPFAISIIAASELILVHGVVEELAIVLGHNAGALLPIPRWQGEKWLAELRMVEALLVMARELRTFEAGGEEDEDSVQ